MSGATRCDEIIRLIDEAIGEAPPTATVSAAEGVGAAGSASRRRRVLCDRSQPVD